MNILELIKSFLQLFAKYNDSLTLIFACVGGLFALHQWRIQIKQKRAEIVEEQIHKVRDDMDISTIMDIIDWNKGFIYDGKFTVADSSKLPNMTDDDLFKKIDKTLSQFTYICYLKKTKAIGKKDFKVFEYSIRRIMDNQHICNYLYSLYHWSRYLGVSSSFDNLIQYGVKKKYLDSSFQKENSTMYKCYLSIPQ